MCRTHPPSLRNQVHVISMWVLVVGGTDSIRELHLQGRWHAVRSRGEAGAGVGYPDYHSTVSYPASGAVFPRNQTIHQIRLHSTQLCLISIVIFISNKCSPLGCCCGVWM